MCYILRVLESEEKIFTLYHGSPAKLQVGDFICPSFFGKYEDVKVPVKNEPAIFLTPHLDMAFRYARREVYSVVDCNDDIQYCIFKHPQQQFYIYKVKLPASTLYSVINGRSVSDINHGEVACFEPVFILECYCYDIPFLLAYYSGKNKMRTMARILKNANKVPKSFGDLNGLFGKPTLDSVRLKEDLNKYTTPRNILDNAGKKGIVFRNIP